MKILIVDDSAINRKLLRVTLQAEKHVTAEAGDGIEALEILKREAFDAIISDILMPGMDGYRLCNQVRKIESLKGILFVLYTGTFTSAHDEKLGLEFGADRFLRKPASRSEILAALDPVIPQRTSPRNADVAELSAMRGYSELLVRRLERRNTELRATRKKFLAANKELTERTEELQAAKSSLEITAGHLQSLFDNLDDVFFSIEAPGGRLTQISPACEKVFGHPREAFFADPLLWMRLAVPADMPVVEGAEARLWTGSPWKQDYRIQRPDGTVRWVAARLKPCIGESGGVVRIDGIISDITARKDLEGQLLHSQKLEAVGRLAGGVAHDFNNLLTAIIGYSELILSQLDRGSSLRSPLVEVKRAGERAAGLTRQLLAFSRKQIIDPVTLDLNAAVREADGMLRRLIGEDIHFGTELAQDLRPVRADPGQIEQVIMNLAVNSRDAMPLGGSLTISTSNAAEFVRLTVSDTGEGMSPEVQAHVFEPFFSTKGPGKGTGLGLATAYGIVEQSGGRISLASEPGKGTTFDIFFPAAEDQVRKSPQHAPPNPEHRGAGTILIAEDNDLIRMLVRRVLSSEGYKVFEARSGEHALQIAGGHKGPIDLLVTDTVMPGISGVALAEQLTAGYPSVKVLFMSGYTADAAALSSILDSGAAFLQKPFGPAVLVRKVNEVMGGSR